MTKRRNKRRKSKDQALVFDVRCAVGPRAKLTTGFAVVVTSGIRSTREESVRHVFITGLRLSVCRALAGRYTLNGMRGDAIRAGEHAGVFEMARSLVLPIGARAASKSTEMKVATSVT